MSYLKDIKKYNLEYTKQDCDVDPSYVSYLNSLSDEEKTEMLEDYWRSQEEWVKVGVNGNTVEDFIFGTIK